MNAVATDIERAAEAVRAANHSTFRGPLDVSESYAAVGNLAELARRLPQVLGFVMRSVRRADPLAHYDDGGADPADALHLAEMQLLDAHDYIEHVSQLLDVAHNQLGRLGRRVTEED